jgi:flagellar biosynthesis/type III secretory pathway protein FliH
MSSDSIEERMWDKGYSRGYEAGLEEGLRTTHNEAEAAIYWASWNKHVTDAQHQKLVKKLDKNVRTLAKFLGVRSRA